MRRDRVGGMRLTEEHVQKFNQILDLLEEAYEAYFSSGETHCKSSDGYAALALPPYFWREEEGVQPGVNIWSYVLASNGRDHYFDSLDEALVEVQSWRDEMMDMVEPCEYCGGDYWECVCEEESLTYSVVFDTESTGVDVLNDRVVQLVIGVYNAAGDVVEFHEWVINPGVEVPQGASDVHGFTNEYLQEHGRDPKEALSEALEVFRKYHRSLHVAYNAKFDVSILDSEFKRHGVSSRWGQAMVSKVPLYDPYVVDRAQDKYRKGKRRLMDVADHFGIGYTEDDLHNARADVDLTYKVFRACLEKYGVYSTWDQARFYREWAKGFREYLARQGKEPDDLTDDWPLQKEEV